jgi:hypothetical protein
MITMKSQWLYYMIIKDKWIGQGDFWVLTFFLCILIAMKKYVFIDKVKYELMI